MGHVSRCLALADVLRREHGGGVTFAARGSHREGVSAIAAAGYELDVICAGPLEDYGDELRRIADARRPSAVVVDVRDALTRASLESLRASGRRVAVIDDATDRRLAADLVFYPPSPAVEELDWRGFSGRRYAGWEWVIVRREFATPPDDSSPASASASSRFDDVGTSDVGRSDVGRSDVGRSVVSAFRRTSDAVRTSDVLITMGGADPAGMTEFTLAALEKISMPLAVCVVVGPAFARADDLVRSVGRSRHAIAFERAPASLAPLVRTARLAVAAFGVTAYELAAGGLPAVHLCLTDDHARMAAVFEREGPAVSAGVFGRITHEQVADAVRALIGDADRRATMAKRGRELVDGRGVERVAAAVTAGL
jgi:spore coat polysaccharide biosynthesis protein SpsF